MTATIFALFAVVNAGAIKDSVRGGDTYQKIVPAVLDQVQKDNSSGQDNTIPFDDPGLQASIEKAFPADDLQTKSETVIDSIFAWLEGKTAEPKFRLDFSNNKQVLATEIGNYAANRAAGLPPCTAQDLKAAQTSDVFSIKCLLPGVTPAQVGKEATAKISGNDSFLKDPIVNSDTLKGENSDLESKQQKAEPIRNFYQKKGLLEILLPLITVLLAVGGVVLASDHARALKRLMHVFIVAAVTLGLVAAVMLYASHKALLSIAGSDALSKIIVPIADGVFQHAAIAYLWFAVISAIFAIGLFISQKRLKA